MAGEKMKVILDTDIGSDIDDALALAYLLCQPRCELVGITTCTGQSLLRVQMASAICRNVGRDDIPIHSGCTEAMLVDIRQKTAPQAAALGDWSSRRDFAPNTAVEFLRKTIRANPGEITLLTIGPLTNIAALLAIDPEIFSQLKQIVLMCGRFFTRMQGEWNAINDPHATAMVYGQGVQHRALRHLSFGLDVTTLCTMTPDQCRNQFTAKALQPVRDFAEIWFQQAKEVTFHDPLAAACIFEPEICIYRQGRVTVSLVEPTLGWTVFDGKADEKIHTVASEVDSRKFFEHYFSVVK